MTTAEKETVPESRSPRKNGVSGAAFRSKDEAVSAARRLGEEVVRVQVKRITGRVKKIAEFELQAVEAADLIERTHTLSASVRVQPTARLTAAMDEAYVGPFKTKEELFDALEAKDQG